MWKSCHIRHGKEGILTKAGIFITVSSVYLVLLDAGLLFMDQVTFGAMSGVIEQVLFILVICALTYGNLVYQVCRLGSIGRDQSHSPAPIQELDHSLDGEAPTLTVLVPAYKEEPDVVYQTLLSAALMAYPAKRVVLLIDDPPDPADPADAVSLEALRDLPNSLTALLARPRRTLQAELEAFQARAAEHDFDTTVELERVAQLCEHCATWYDEFANACQIRDHVSRFFIEEILRHPAQLHRQNARQMRDRHASSSAAKNSAAIEGEYRRLLGFFTAEFSSFERKRYANLSKEANKAMNLNSYLAVMGKRVREDFGADGQRRLEICGPGELGLELPDADYIVTLDGDSLLRFDYATRLVNFMGRPENARVAVAQTPYSAYPQAPGALERIAGATTDIQHLVHQGFTRYNGTFWVGANALIRRAALDDIAVLENESGIEVIKYIQDATVIEDTESTVDLMLKGWRLYNYPDRLAFSATPPDFGSLVIQRRRWSNGGLIILPKLLRHLFTDSNKALQSLVQIHYLISPAATSAAVLLLIFYPFEDSMRSPWLPMTVLPFFYFYGRDLKLTSYRWSDLLRVYALNLMLLPVQLGGAIQSLRQLITGRKSVFGRTPKVRHRTISPKLYLGSVVLLCVYCLSVAFLDIANERWVHSAFTFITGLFLAYAITNFIGLRSAFEDLMNGRIVHQQDHATYSASDPPRRTSAVPSPEFGTTFSMASQDKPGITVRAE